MHKLVKLMAVSALAVPGLLLAGPAQADGDNSAFGQHVQMHAKGDMGFDGSHNPGMHQGKSGWEPHTHPMMP
ncbi:hypothetical protein ACPYOC_02255 [Ornithinimicrobium sp. W1665]|nr:hypothetical protein [Ornithinimicrobium flavum]